MWQVKYGKCAEWHTNWETADVLFFKIIFVNSYTLLSVINICFTVDYLGPFTPLKVSNA